MTEKNIIIFSGKVARDLIQKEYKIVDIQPDRKLPVKSVFYFENTEDIKKYLLNEHDIKVK